jgi:hypothetical protein
MIHTTYVLRGGKLVRKRRAPLRAAVNVMPDIAPFVTQEGVPIGSRSGLRAYERRNGVRQVGNDFATLHAALRAKADGARE